MLPNPEIRPSADEAPPVIGPNLAGDQALCADVAKYITNTFWFPYWIQQQPFLPAWKRIDDAWRVRTTIQESAPVPVTGKALKEAQPSTVDGSSAKAQNPMFFRQIKAITDVGEQFSFEDGIPLRAEVPEEVDEEDLYQPTRQSCIAANAIFRQTAEEVNLRDHWRRAFGNFCKYGFAWILTPFDQRITAVRLDYPISPDPMLAQGQLQQIAARHPGQPLIQDREGYIGVVEYRKHIQTGFRATKISDVLIDPFIECDPIELQPCPLVREYSTNAELESNRYHPEHNPFGFLNIEQAIQSQRGHFILENEDEQQLRDMLRTRYNLTDNIMSGVGRDHNRQRWTAFPLLRISDDGKLDTGDGVDCPHCKGQGKHIVEGMEVECPTCQGAKKVHPPLKRYVVQMYGGLRQATTILRIQEMPEGMRVPICYAADLVEDDSCAIKMSPAEMALIACNNLSRAEVQFEDAKTYAIYRGWKVKDDSPAAQVQDFNKPNLKILFENSAEEAQRIESSNYDETVTLLPYIQRCENQIQQILGATDTLLGMLAAGRRSAMEVGQATEAAKNPLILKTDRFNRSMMGQWGRQTLDNLEMFGDRDYIRRKTGREYFGKVRLWTAVAQDFVKKAITESNLRWLLQSSPAIPALQPVMPELCNRLLRMMGIQGIRVPDGGIAKGIADGHALIAQILGDGAMTFPTPSDPHEIYIAMFDAALKDPYWRTHAPQNLPVLAQRKAMQEQMFAQIQMQQMLMAMQQQSMQMQLEGGAAPGKNPPQGEATPGGNMQSAQG